MKYNILKNCLNSYSSAGIKNEDAHEYLYNALHDGITENFDLKFILNFLYLEYMVDLESRFFHEEALKIFNSKEWQDAKDEKIVAEIIK